MRLLLNSLYRAHENNDPARSMPKSTGVMGTSSWDTDVNGVASDVPNEEVSTTMDANALVVIKAIEGSDT